MAKLIYATADGVHKLLRNGEVPVVGKVYDLSKRLLPCGAVVPVRLVQFDWNGDGAIDSFYFENGLLAYHSVSLKRKGEMIVFYQEVLKTPNLKFKDFIRIGVNLFVFIEMGF